MCLISGNPDFQAVSEPPQKKVTRIEPQVMGGGRSSLGQLGSWLGSLCPERVVSGKASPMGITCVCLTLEEEGWLWMGQSELQLPLTSLLGEQAEPGWQDCPGVLITLSKGDSGHRSNLQFLFSSIVYLLSMSFKLNVPKLFLKKNIKLNE